MRDWIPWALLAAFVLGATGTAWLAVAGHNRCLRAGGDRVVTGVGCIAIDAGGVVRKVNP